MAIEHVILVGHCGFDSRGLMAFIKEVNRGGDVKITRVNKQKGLAEYRNEQSLWLINRVLDGRFDAGDGLEMIKLEAQEAGGHRLMLITNYEDWLDAAQKAGGLEGFGKSEVGTSQAGEILKRAMR